MVSPTDGRPSGVSAFAGSPAARRPGASVRDHGSLWAAVSGDAPECPPLEGSTTTDTVIVGGGFTGLSTALALRRDGVDCCVLEAAEPGWGASGRNNGQVIPTLSKPDPDDIEARHGEAGERFVALLRDSAQTLFDTVRRHGLEAQAEAEQRGWVQPVHSPGRIAIAQRRVRQWSARGAPVELLDAEAVRAMLGSDAWHGGFWNRTGGHVNPLGLVRGLARAALGAGARIHGQTPVTAFAREGGQWVVRHAGGTVRARALLLATGTYTGEFAPNLAPAIAREMVPVVSWQMATEPLSPAVAAAVLPGRHAMSDTHGELYFARPDARGRLVTGGAIALPFAARSRLQTMIGERLARLWPALGAVRFDHVWNGFVGMTPDFLPRFHRLGPDGFAWAGCNGRAIALAVALGPEFAKALQGARDQDLALPFTQPEPLPMQSVARWVAPLMLWKYRRMDRAEIG